MDITIELTDLDETRQVCGSPCDRVGKGADRLPLANPYLPGRDFRTAEECIAAWRRELHRRLTSGDAETILEMRHLAYRAVELAQQGRVLKLTYTGTACRPSAEVVQKALVWFMKDGSSLCRTQSERDVEARRAVTELAGEAGRARAGY